MQGFTSFLKTKLNNKRTKTSNLLVQNTISLEMSLGGGGDFITSQGQKIKATLTYISNREVNQTKMHCGKRVLDKQANPTILVEGEEEKKKKKTLRFSKPSADDKTREQVFLFKNILLL